MTTLTGEPGEGPPRLGACILHRAHHEMREECWGAVVDHYAAFAEERPDLIGDALTLAARAAYRGDYERGILRIGSVCSGYGGLDMAVQQVFGGQLTWVADPDAGASRILAHHWPDVPNLGDIKAVDWSAVEPVDIFCAGYPCQPFSNSGLQKGIEDERHIWPWIAAALGVLRPRIAIFENVAGHLRRGFDTVLADLAGLGFDVEWACVRAEDVGAPHRRERLFILAAAADAADLGHERGRPARDWRHGPAHRRGTAADAYSDALVTMLDCDPQRVLEWGAYASAVHRWERLLGRPAPAPTEPGLNGQPRLTPRFVEWMMGLPAGHVTDVPGLSRNQMLHALGNGVVPQQAAHALRALSDRAALREVA